MAAQLQIEVLTPAGVVYQETAYEVVVPTIAGELGILPHHIPIVAATKLGIVSVRRQPTDSNDDMDHMVIGSGLLEVSQNQVRVMVDEGERARSIDELDIRRQLAAAEQRLKAARDRLEIATAQAAVERSLTWLKGAELGRNRRGGHHS